MIPLLLFLLACAAIYVGTVQSAFSVLMRFSLRLMAERNGRGERLGRYLDDPVLLFLPARVLLALIYTAVAVLLIALTGAVSGRALGAVAISVVAFAVLCEHLLPWLIIRRDPERVLEVLLPSFAVAAGMVQPVTALLLRIPVAFRRDRHWPAQGNGETDVEKSGAGVRPAPERQTEDGGMSDEQRRLLQSILEFGETLVREVMTPRPDIVAIRSDATLDELRALFREQEYSRIPVFKDNLDNILGFVFVKDLIQLEGVAGEERPVGNLLRTAYVVPETKRVPELLKEFQRRQVQIAIVVDEYGGTAGLVTLEDLLEEIVGEIRDEYDVESDPIVAEGHGSYVFSGKVSIHEVADRLGVEIEPEGFETMGGYLLSHLGRVATVGETFEIDDLSVEVLEAERRRVTRVRARRRQPVAQSVRDEP
jgi:putative hemolysin